MKEFSSLSLLPKMFLGGSASLHQLRQQVLLKQKGLLHIFILWFSIFHRDGRVMDARAFNEAA